MKKFMLATVAVLGLAGAANAGAASEPLTFSGYGEYAVEAQTFEIGAGASYTTGAVIFSGLAVFDKPNNVKLDLDHVDLGVSYAVATSTELYGKVTLDDTLGYSETTVGVAFSF